MTTTLPPSPTEPHDSAFDLLHPEVRRWIWLRGWTSLRDIQNRAIKAIINTDKDMLIAAATATGKTEAAFLPILTQIADKHAPGIKALYVGPLKALINDQFLRLEELCDRLHVPVTKWHGDASATGKRRVRENPDGVLLITPESIEAFFARRAGQLKSMFSRLDFIVVDEVHAFIGTERGVHLASLLKRIDAFCGVRPRRIGLSATLADPDIAATWLRPDDPQAVQWLESTSLESDLKLQIRGISEPAKATAADDTVAGDRDDTSTQAQIARHLFRVLRTKGNHLIFAGSRQRTEELADRLRFLCETAGVPNEFFPHHGSLSKDVREALETRLKDGKLPTTALATTTLELGIDIGSVKSIAQIGAPASVAALKQRVGRSGRREGEPAILRMYIPEEDIGDRSSITDHLRLQTIQAVAVIRLLLAHKIEPPDASTLHLSTLLHQTLALIVQHGGILAKDAFRLLSGPGPFVSINWDLYRDLLRTMARTKPPLIEQAPDGTMMLGPRGETITGRYDFFAVFKTPDEYVLISNDKKLGTLSIVNALGAGDFLIFAGRRWKVSEIDDRAKCVYVAPAPAGKLPKFEGEFLALHDMIVEEMYRVYLDGTIPEYLNQICKQHLAEGRQFFRKTGLDKRSLVATGSRVYLFPWKGTKSLDTLRLALKFLGFVAESRACHIVIHTTDPKSVIDGLKTLASAPPNAEILAKMQENLVQEKYDPLLTADLLRKNIEKTINVNIIKTMCQTILSGITAEL